VVRSPAHPGRVTETKEHSHGYPTLDSEDVEGDILFQAGTHSDAVRLNFRDWYEMVQPQVATFSEPAELAHA
jgi:hypothetical protein